MMRTASMRYSDVDKRSFKSYFTPPAPVKRKRGRPKKKKRKIKVKTEKVCEIKQPKKQQKKIKSEHAKKLSVRTSEQLHASLEGVIAKCLRQKKATRENWDKGANKVLREKLAQSWLNKNDAYKDGETFERFVKRNGIPRNCLRRYLAKKKAGEAPKKRGRPTLLSEDVMRHICESLFVPCFAFINQLDCLFCCLPQPMHCLSCNSPMHCSRGVT